MAVQDERRPDEPSAPDAELLRAALRATEARIARSSVPLGDLPGHAHPAAHPAGPPPSLHPSDDVAAVEHRVDHLAESFGEAMQAHARFRSWVTAAIEDLSARVLGGADADAPRGVDTDVARRLDELGTRLDAFDEQAARMVTYLTGLAEELQRRMDRIESALVDAPAAHPGAGTSQPGGGAAAIAPVPKITLRPILPPDAPRH